MWMSDVCTFSSKCESGLNGSSWSISTQSSLAKFVCPSYQNAHSMFNPIIQWNFDRWQILPNAATHTHTQAHNLLIRHDARIYETWLSHTLPCFGIKLQFIRHTFTYKFAVHLVQPGCARFGFYAVQKYIHTSSPTMVGATAAVHLRWKVNKSSWLTSTIDECKPTPYRWSQVVPWALTTSKVNTQYW